MTQSREGQHGKQSVRVGLLLSLCLLAAVCLGLGESVAYADDDTLRVLKSDAEGIVVELSIPPYSVQPVGGDSDGYGLAIDGYETGGAAGQPALPRRSFLVGIPNGAQINLELLEAGGVVVENKWVAPVPTRRLTNLDLDTVLLEHVPAFEIEYLKDAAIYDADAFYPSHVVSVASLGHLRDQRYVEILVQPVQYNPVQQQIRQYQHLKFRLSFSYPGGVEETSEVRPQSPAFEEILRQSIVNYEMARTWRASSETVESIGRKSMTAQSPVSTPAYKIKIGRTGLYQLTYNDLAAAGLPVATLDPRTFRLLNLGEEVAIYVLGEDDGQFDPGDYIHFYGVGINTKYTNVSVYWLSYGGAYGLRMAEKDGTPYGATVPSSFPAARHEEDDNWYWSYLPMQETEHWYWDYVQATSGPVEKTFSVDLADIATETSTATLRIMLLGGTSYAAVNPDHHVQLYLNGMQVGETYWDGLTANLAVFEFPQSYLGSGVNQLKLRVPRDMGAAVDSVVLDWFELEYLDIYMAEADELTFGVNETGTWEYHVAGFSGPEVVILDVTDPPSPTLIVSASVSGTLPYTVQFEDVVDEADVQYFAAEQSSLLVPQSIEEDIPSDLVSLDNGADYIIITHRQFYTEVLPLADYRASQGLRTMVVDVQDVYDEFGYGLVDPDAIKGFLAYAYAQWQSPAPSYVVLVGDGTWDPKDNLGTGIQVYIPPYLALVDPWLGETAVDNRYVSVSGGDIIPDMLIGRLPVNSPAETASIVNKTLAYEQNPPIGDWNRRLLFVADNADAAGNFAALSDDIADNYVPLPYTSTKAYLGVTCPYQNPSVACKQEVLANINSGSLLINYIGHAAIQQWAGEKLLHVTDLPGLTNGGKLPVMLPMTCYEGYFHYPGFPSLGESIVRIDGKGAVASWSPTGLGVTYGHDYLNEGFFSAVFYDDIREVGAAAYVGKLWLYQGRHQPGADRRIHPLRRPRPPHQRPRPRPPPQQNRRTHRHRPTRRRPDLHPDLLQRRPRYRPPRRPDRHRPGRSSSAPPSSIPAPKCSPNTPASSSPGTSPTC